MQVHYHKSGKPYFDEVEFLSIQDVAARTGGELKLSAGTLYRSIQRMLEQGLLVETRERPAPEEDDEADDDTPATPQNQAAKPAPPALDKEAAELLHAHLDARAST